MAKPFQLGRLTYFEVCTGNVLGKKAEYHYILIRGYTGGTNYKKTEEHADRNPQTFTVTNTVSNLIYEYINAGTWGYGIQVGDRRLLPVRNMCSDDKNGIKLGYAPLNEKEMVEFKCLLRARDSERYKLSFKRS